MIHFIHRNLECIYQSFSPRKSNFVASKEYHNNKDIISICKENKELIHLISNCMSVQPDAIGRLTTLNSTDSERSLQQVIAFIESYGMSIMLNL